MNDLIASRGFRIAVFVLGGLILLFAGFDAGVSVGERKERHFSNRNANFENIFVPRPQMMMRGPLPTVRPPLPPAHGVFGKVISVSWPSIVISAPDNTEQEVVATSSTQIRIGRAAGTQADIAPGVDAAVFGSPNAAGQIEAQLIRITTAQAAQ
jgi:hypothetical protein